MPVKNDRPPRTSRHHEIGWSVPPVDVPSPAASASARQRATVWTLPVGRVCQRYQTSVRLSSSGRSRVDGCTRSPASSVRVVAPVGLAGSGRAPISSSNSALPGSLSAAVPMPTKPPPPSMKSASARSCPPIEALAGVEEDDRPVPREAEAAQSVALSVAATWYPPPGEIGDRLDPCRDLGMSRRARMEYEDTRGRRLRLARSDQRPCQRSRERVHPPLSASRAPSRVSRTMRSSVVDLPKFHLSPPVSSTFGARGRNAYASSRCGTREGGPMKYRIALTALVMLALAPSAHAQYTAPPPEPGFEYIFDGTAIGSDGPRFDKWLSANGATAVTLDPALGAMNPNTSGFGMKWYPVRALGDVVVKLQYMWPAGATPNGGVMVRFPEPRYVGTTAEVLAQKPTGYNYDLCPGAAPSFCGLPAPAPSTTYDWPGGDLPFPPPYRYEGSYCARNGTNNVTNIAGTFPAPTGSNANNHQHWLSVYAVTRSRSTRRSRSPAATPSRPARCTASRTSTRGRRELRAPAAGRLALDGDPDGRPAAHGPGRRKRDQPVRQQPAARGVARRRPADPGPPVPARLLRAPDPRRHRPDLLSRDPGQGARRGRHPAQHRATRRRRLRQGRHGAELRPRRVEARRSARLRLHVVPQQPDRALRTCATTRRRRRTSAASTLRPTRSSGRCRCRTAAR